jgi:diguanylate cyclase (GGDEF)-like protein
MRQRGRPRRAADPRALVAAGFLLALALVATSAMLFVRSSDERRSSLRHIRVALEEPLDHLGDALEANTSGEALLQLAVVATGEERSALLSESIAMAETAAKAWTGYRASALHLPGEPALAAAYERDYAAGKAIAGEVLVPIIQSDQPMPLPAEQITAAESNRRDLIALQAIYEREDHAALRSLGEQQLSERRGVLISAAALVAMLVVGFGFALRLAHRAVADRRERATRAELTEFEGRLSKAFDFADTDDDAFRVAARALEERFGDDTVVSVIVADASQATFAPIDAAPSCGVTSVEQCRAFRSGASLQFSDSGGLDTCPRLLSGATTPCSATCVPVSVAGMHAAVVQLTGPVGAPPELANALPLVVRQLGDRITMMRAIARFQLQASHDPLTGLLNRRSLEDAVSRLTASDTPYVVAFADLDHFKLLNDVHGHDVGDRALRAFATTLKATLRPDDFVGRWGGEEFVVVLPDCDQQEAIDAMDRVRAQLGSDAQEGSNVAVTVSVGIAVRQPAEPFDHVVARADQALHLAKGAGRNRVEAWRPGPATPEAATTEDAEHAPGTSAR